MILCPDMTIAETCTHVTRKPQTWVWELEPLSGTGSKTALEGAIEEMTYSSARVYRIGATHRHMFDDPSHEDVATFVQS